MVSLSKDDVRAIVREEIARADSEADQLALRSLAEAGILTATQAERNVFGIPVGAPGSEPDAQAQLRKELAGLRLDVQCVRAETEDLAGLMKSQRDLLNGLREQMEIARTLLSSAVIGQNRECGCVLGCHRALDRIAGILDARLGQTVRNPVVHNAELIRIEHWTSPSVGEFGDSTVGERRSAGERSSSPADTAEGGVSA